MQIQDDKLSIFKDQVEELLDENAHLDPEFKIPLEEFALNIPKLESLRKMLRDREESVVQQIEESRLRRQLECHFLKEAAWNTYKRSPPSMICSVSGLLRVKNYPMKTVFPSSTHTRVMFESLKSLLESVGDSLKNDERIVWTSFMNMDQNSILFRQYDLITHDIIENQIIFLQVIECRLMEEFNTAFEAKRSKKGSLIKEIKQLVQQWNYLKREVQKLEVSDNEESQEVVRSTARANSTRPFCESPSGYYGEEEFEVPEWFLEELPEKLLYVEDEELTKGESKAEDIISKDDGSSMNEFLDVREEKLSFATTKYSPQIETLANAIYGEKESPWPWIESQEKRMQKVNEEKDKRRCFNNANKLQLQLQRIQPNMENLMKELDSEIFSLSFLKIQTFQKLQTIGTMILRLKNRLDQERQLQNRLTTVKQHYSKLERDSKELSGRIDALFHRESKARLRMELVMKSLREENVAFQRTFISLPVDQYQYLQATYRDDETGEDNDSPNNVVATTIHKEKKISAESEDLKKTAIGNRTWKQFLKYKKRKIDIDKELEEATSSLTEITTKLELEHSNMHEISSSMEKAASEITELDESITTLSNDVELFLLIPGKRVKININDLIENLTPNFTIGKLITISELEDFEKKAGSKIDGEDLMPLEHLRSAVNKVSHLNENQKSGDMEENIAVDPDENTKNKSEVIELQKEKYRLLLQVELADERLKQIMQLKLGRQSKVESQRQTDRDDKGPTSKQGHSEIYDSVIKLQKIQEKDIKLAKQRITRENKKVLFSKTRIKSLQIEIDELSEEIEVLQRHQLLRSKRDELLRETRVQQIMAVNRYSEALKKKEENMINLQQALQNLSVRTFPMLPDKK